jgi:serine/threonine protein kinase/tetratricopeptide (TPR) repeat protein
MGAIDAERLRSAVASRLFGVEAEPVKIGRFTILKRLGAGGMGVVYSAYDDQLDRKLAIKLLRGDANEHRSARLMREAQALARVSHPNVIHVYEVDTFRGQIFLAMEFVRGQSLDRLDRSPEGETSFDEMLDYFLQAGEGLVAAHSAGLIHRDFKPENCLVGDDGRVRVLDFGLARASGEDPEGEDLDEEERRQLLSASSSADEVAPGMDRTAPLKKSRLGTSSSSMDQPLTRTGAIMGTPAYMAPEQHLGAVVDERSDQFSFCVSLWEKLYGERPFPGDTLAALALSVTRGKVREAPSGRGVPKWIHRVLLKGLSVDADERWPDMRTLLVKLSPERRSRRRLIVGFAALTTLALASFAWSATRDSVGPCEGSERELAGIWDSQVRASVQRSFEAAEEGYAEDVFKGTASLLDGYTERWVGMHRQACVDRQVEQVDSPELYGRKMMCLGQRLARVEQLVAEMKEIDPGALAKVGQAAADLPVLGDCADAEVLAGVDSVVDEVTRAKLDTVERILARVETKLGLGRYPDALELAEQAVVQAKELGRARVEARALLVLGRAQGRLSRLDEAEATLREAVRRADVAHDDTTRVRAWIWLLYWVGSVKRDFGQADVIAADTRAALEKLGDAPLLWAEFNAKLGSIARQRNELETAAGLHRAAIETRISELGERSVFVAISRNNLGNTYLDQGDLEKAEDEFRLARAGFEEVLGKWHPHTSISVTNLGIVHARRAERLGGEGAAEQYAEAEVLFRQALEINERGIGRESRMNILGIHNLGQMLLDSEKYEQAIVEFNKALDLKEQTFSEGHASIAKTLVGRGRAYHGSGEHQEARTDLERAAGIYMANAKTVGPGERAECLFALAQALEATGDKDTGLVRAIAARDLYIQAGEAHDHTLKEVLAWLESRQG